MVVSGQRLRGICRIPAMPRRRAGVLLLAWLLALTGSGCAGIAAGRAPVSTPVAAVASPGVARPASPGPSPSPVRTATPIPFSGPTFILIRAPDITAGARLNFPGLGFLPREIVDVRLGGLGGSPLATFPSDAQGNVAAQNVPLPLIQAGDYLLYFVGEHSQTPVSIGFNIQGFTPWVVLDSYSVAPYSA